jgi:hypothetical protein
VVADALSRKRKPQKGGDDQVLLPRETLKFGVHPDDFPLDNKNLVTVRTQFSMKKRVNTTLKGQASRDKEMQNEGFEVAPITLVSVVERVLSSNRSHESLEESRQLARRGDNK